MFQDGSRGPRAMRTS